MQKLHIHPITAPNYNFFFSGSDEVKHVKNIFITDKMFS